MPVSPYASWLLEQEARALLTRLARVKPFVMQETMLPAAGLMPNSQMAIEHYLMRGRRHLRELVNGFIAWLRSPRRRAVDGAEVQRRFTILRLRFTAVLTQFDLFNDVITQRSESETGIWLSGLDVVAADALRLPSTDIEIPPVICYLDRGVGAAIRRARTRLPGGGDNPVAIIKVPRERMVGSGIASSLVHEVGHQGAALLGLVESLLPVLRGLGRGGHEDSQAWHWWERWISEIVADFWSVSRVGIASTMGLMGVVSLPRAFVFRVHPEDPHPAPWIRVKLSAAIGKALYPQAAWDRLIGAWEEFYPLAGVAEEQHRLFTMLERTMPGLVTLLVNHRPAALKGRSLVEALDTSGLQPAGLRALLAKWRAEPGQMYQAGPTLVFAVIGQGRADGNVTPEEESVVVGKLLSHWALQSTLQVESACAAALASPHLCGKCSRNLIRHSKQISGITRRNKCHVQ
jgi:hypothetical protein